MTVKAGATPEVQFNVPGGLDLSFIAGEALTGHQYKPMYLSAERTVKLMTDSQASGGYMFVGFLQSGDIDSSVTVASGDYVSVRVSGVSLMVAQAALSMGVNLMPADSQGRLATATDNLIVVGQALEAGSIINHLFAGLIIHCPIKGDNT